MYSPSTIFVLLNAWGALCFTKVGLGGCGGNIIYSLKWSQFKLELLNTSNIQCYGEYGYTCRRSNYYFLPPFPAEINSWREVFTPLGANSIFQKQINDKELPHLQKQEFKQVNITLISEERQGVFITAREFIGIKLIDFETQAQKNSWNIP